MSDTDDDDCPNTIAPKGWENGIQLTEEEADFLDAMMGRAPSIYQETQLTPLDCQASEFAWIKASVDMRTPRQWLANEVFVGQDDSEHPPFSIDIDSVQFVVETKAKF